MTGQSDWTGRVGATWADEWRRTDRSFAPLTKRLLDHPTARDFTAALDVGCGAGELACRLAGRQPDRAVTGIDISADLLAVARERCSGPRFAEADASSFRPDGEAPDLIVSRHGVMFFADPSGAFAHLAEVAAPGATLRFSCFREREVNGWAMSVSALFPGAVAPTDPHAPGPFAFGKRAHVARILESAGWQSVDFEALDYPMLAGEGELAVEEAFAYFQRIGPAARALAALEGDEREVALVRLREMLEAQCESERVALPAAAWIVTARAPG